MRSLNPSFNGIWSRTSAAVPTGMFSSSLNPSFNGIWSRTYFKTAEGAQTFTSLNPSFNGIWSRTTFAILAIVLGLIVLILLLMEYGLGLHSNSQLMMETFVCLNPSFNGIWSRTQLEVATESHTALS